MKLIAFLLSLLLGCAQSVLPPDRDVPPDDIPDPLLPGLVEPGPDCERGAEFPWVQEGCR